MSEHLAGGGVAWWPDGGGDRELTWKSTRELRKFAAVVSVPLVCLGGYLLWQGRWPGYVLSSAGALLLLVAAVTPRALAPVERAWMKAAGALSVVSTYVILALAFFLVMTPVGFFVRRFSSGGLSLGAEPGRDSYWEPVEPEGPATRPDRPF
ncbi:MAG TPA: hypothetical protein VFG50_06610 [Rhodothermales bacterium]|nr:hypothetical protein [Rhodothermales bacterium]